MKKLEDLLLLSLSIILLPICMLYLIGFAIAGLFITGKKKVE